MDAGALGQSCRHPGHLAQIGHPLADAIVPTEAPRAPGRHFRRLVEFAVPVERREHGGDICISISLGTARI
jgi:hypothetical protein